MRYKISLSFIGGWFLIFSLFSSEVKIEETPRHGYRLLVDGKPFLIKGVIYNPIPPGNNYNFNYWDEKLEFWLEDGALMKKAGFNVIRFYAPSEDLEATRKLIRKFYNEFGIYTIMGHWLGFWNYPSPFYADKEFQERIKKEVIQMVKALKDEEGLLMWVLGNENNYSFSGKVNPWTSEELEKIKDPLTKLNKKAEIYYSFVNEIAKEIKKIDKKHPVALGNGELGTLDIAARCAKDIDILALISYRGRSFGHLFDSVKNTFDRPVLISEFGCDAYDAYRKQEDQDIQAEFILSQWKDIYRNTSFFKEGGNCLGGVIFEWNDEWWKHSPEDPSRWGYHDTLGGWSNGSYYFDIKAPRNLNMNEEWFGLISFEKNKEGKGFVKKPRKVYYLLREFFQNPQEFLEVEQ